MKAFIFISLLLTVSCKNSGLSRVPATASHIKGKVYESTSFKTKCLESVSFFKLPTKLTSPQAYAKKISKSKNTKKFHEKELLKAGYPQAIAKRVSEKYPEVAKEIITSKYGADAFYKGYRGLRLDGPIPELYMTTDKRENVYGGDYFSENKGVTDYFRDTRGRRVGVVFEAFIPKGFTDKGIGTTRNSFIMTHKDPFIFINKVQIISPRGEESKWMPLEEALRKRLLIIND